MSLAPIAKIKIITHKNNGRDFIHALQDLSFVQIEKCTDSNYQVEYTTEKIADLDYQLASVKFTLDFLSEYSNEKKSLTKLFNNEIVVDKNGVETVVAKTNTIELATVAQNIEKQINEGKAIIDHSEQELNKIEVWKNLSFIPNQQDLGNNYSFALVQLATDNISKLINKLNEIAPLSQVDSVYQNNKDAGISIIYHTSQANKVALAISELSGKTIELPNLNQKISDRIVTLNQLIATAKRSIEKSNQEALKLSQNKEKLKIVFDYLTWQRQILLASEQVGQTSQTSTIIGWVPKKSLDALNKALHKITTAYYIEELPIDPNDNVPVLFQNKWAQPFEAVTMVYGAPQYNEPDPTPFLTPFFTLFFGLAITDAGYGLVMALGILAAIYGLKIPKSKRKLLWVLFWGGISSMIIGAAMGGWFSADLQTIPAPLGSFLQSLVLLNPLEDPLSFFYLSLALGVIQVLAGISLNIYWKLKHGNWSEAIFGSGAWIVTIVSLLVFAAASMGFAPAVAAVYTKWLIWAGLASIVLQKASQKKNFLLGIPGGLLSLYSFVGYFSDVLSYSRLLALGLTTGIIGMVVNIIAGLTLDIPYIGWLVALIVLIGGHIFNIGINALGAFIHSGRLQYIEFFPKFMEGGGSVFQPFSRESTYTKLTN